MLISLFVLVYSYGVDSHNTITSHDYSSNQPMHNWFYKSNWLGIVVNCYWPYTRNMWSSISTVPYNQIKYGKLNLWSDLADQVLLSHFTSYRC